MNILITNAYCYLNKGDSGIIRAMVQEFRKEYPQARITVISLFPELDQDKYGDCRVVGGLLSPYKGKSRLAKVLRNSFRWSALWAANLLKLPVHPTLREFREADIVVSCGGGYFKARNLAQFLGDFMYHYVQFMTAVQYRKPFVIYAQTVGEFGENALVQSKIRRIIKKSALCLPREPISSAFLKRFVPDADNCFETSDIAFLLEKKEIGPGRLQKLLTSNSMKIGITMRSWHFPGEANRDELLAGYKETMRQTILHLAGIPGAQVFLMPQCIGPGEDNDLIISREIHSRLEGLPNVHLIGENLTPEELKGVYSCMDLFLGTRMHSNIFSLSEGVPCVAVSYDPKTDGIMKAVGLEEYVLPIKGIKEQALISLVDKALADLDGMRRTLSRTLPGLKAKSRLNNTLLYDVIASGGATPAKARITAVAGEWQDA
ncbi:polysaccharide pyruvyl transferase family protein [Gorillibacterium timonense]|uniref:polysaccharide pyruvyl transferase family protein n=1 Tax=Gorillibacterium timonense TaxID=1689269 RepID=UPI00071D647D|nr:polysaccharide pyruvyl transferase family protein [Gorillibacterium timonense]